MNINKYGQWVAFVGVVVIIIIISMWLTDSGIFYRPPEPVNEQSFDDVLPDHWAYEEIELIYSYGITVGCSYDPPLYCPDRPMTRAEAAVFAAKLLEIIKGD